MKRRYKYQFVGFNQYNYLSVKLLVVIYIKKGTNTEGIYAVIAQNLNCTAYSGSEMCY